MAGKRGRQTFPLGWSLAALTGTAVAVAAALALLVSAMTEAEGAERTVVWMVGVCWVFQVLALIPVWGVSRLGLMPVVYAYFGGAAFRLLASLGLLAVAIGIAQLPPVAVAVGVLSAYLCMLFVEVAFVGRYLWTMDQPPVESAAEVGS